MNFSQFMLDVSYYYYNNHEQRYGQACFNVLHAVEPKLANEIRGTNLDPFHRDERVPEFLAKVRDHLG